MNVFEQKVNAIFDKMLETMQTNLPAHFPKTVVRPDLLINQKSCVTFVARAQLFPSKNLGVVQFSTVYLDELIKQGQLKETTYHELAHLIQRMYFPKSAHHGREWGRIMYENGFPFAGSRCLGVKKLTKQQAIYRGFH